ncbi:MAG: GFA family protein [Kofleriaceae bacterium]
MTTSSTTYAGGCHCGAVRYRVTFELGKVIDCNCSMCSKRGGLLAFAPASAFELERGDGELTSYRFNTHKIEHLFCKTCGIASFSRGTGADGPTVAINARCLDGVEVDALERMPYDGKRA